MDRFILGSQHYGYRIFCSLSLRCFFPAFSCSFLGNLGKPVKISSFGYIVVLLLFFPLQMQKSLIYFLLAFKDNLNLIILQ